MKSIWAVPVLASILILGLIGYGSIVFGDDSNEIESGDCSGDFSCDNFGDDND